jgi:hypothetical protein
LSEWTNTKDTQFPLHGRLPRRRRVDLWGLHDYDNAQKDLSFATLVAEAARHGKKVGVCEWACAGTATTRTSCGRMFEKFRANAANLAYESYFNRKAEHRALPDDPCTRCRPSLPRLWRP